MPKAARAQLDHGRWQDVLGDLGAGSVDTLLCDPPYSERTCKGQRSAVADDASPTARIAYPPLARTEQDELVAWADTVVSSWFVAFCDHEQVARYDVLFERMKKEWLRFAPVAWIKRGAAPRMGGDGPSPHLEFIFIARRRRRLPLRFRPGFYEATQVRGAPLVGAKPLDLMERLVGDYSEPGQLIVDPFMGTGTTGVAAMVMGRSFRGAEVDAATFEYANARVRSAAAHAPRRKASPSTSSGHPRP